MAVAGARGSAPVAPRGFLNDLRDSRRFHIPTQGKFRTKKNSTAASVTEIQNQGCRGRSPGKGRRPASIRNSDATKYKATGQESTQRAFSRQAASQWPWSISCVARVAPQPGQFRPVSTRKLQSGRPIFAGSNHQSTASMVTPRSERPATAKRRGSPGAGYFSCAPAGVRRTLRASSAQSAISTALFILTDQRRNAALTALSLRTVSAQIPNGKVRRQQGSMHGTRATMVAVIARP